MAMKKIADSTPVNDLDWAQYGTGLSFATLPSGLMVFAFDPKADYGLTEGKTLADGSHKGGGNTRVATTHGSFIVGGGVKVGINVYRENIKTGKH